MRNASITARELFDQLQEKLGLRWLAGQAGGNRSIESGDTIARRPSLPRICTLLG